MGVSIVFRESLRTTGARESLEGTRRESSARGWVGDQRLLTLLDELPGGGAHAGRSRTGTCPGVATSVQSQQLSVEFGVLHGVSRSLPSGCRDAMRPSGPHFNLRHASQ